jgi:hypothetical protein
MPQHSSVTLCSGVTITVGVEFDKNGQSSVHITIKRVCLFWSNYERRHLKKRQSMNVKLVATVPTLLCENDG